MAFIDLVFSFADMPLHQFLGVEEHEMESLDQSSAHTCYYPMPAAPKQASEKVGPVYFDLQLSQRHHWKIREKLGGGGGGGLMAELSMCTIALDFAWHAARFFCVSLTLFKQMLPFYLQPPIFATFINVSVQIHNQILL